MGGFVFSAPTPTYHPLEYEGELLWVPRDVNRQIEHGIPCILLQQRDASHFLLYFHANAEDLGQIYVLLRHLRTALGLHVLAVEYPGYGVCSGEACEETLLADAEAVAGFIQHHLKVPLTRVVLWGRSLGGGAAIYLASKYQFAGLVTVGTFSSVRAVVNTFAGWAGWYPNIFNNGQRIRSVSCPTLIIHGDMDKLVDVGQARELEQLCGIEFEGMDRPNVILDIRSAGHNDLDVRVDLVSVILNAFPCLCDLEAKPLHLSSVDYWLSGQPHCLSSDVLSRTPYNATWKPRNPPWRNIRIVDNVDGVELLI